MGDTPPAWTTVQPAASAPEESREPDDKGRYGTLEQIPIVAVRGSR
jgi:hypothetical protein